MFYFVYFCSVLTARRIFTLSFAASFRNSMICAFLSSKYDLDVFIRSHTHAINRLSGSTILSIVNVLVHLSKFIFSLFRSFLRSLSPSPFHSFFITCFFLYMCVCVRVCGKSLFSVCLLVYLLCSFSLGRNTITFLLFLGLVAYK